MITRRTLLAGLASFSLLPIAGRASTVAEYCANAEELRFLAILNDYRASFGVAPLALSQTLGAAAEHHALDMAATGTFSHTLSDGTDWLQNIINHDYPGTYRSENIAWGFTSAESVFAAWQASDGHNVNMLRTGFGACGIARRFSANGYPNWVNTFACCLDTPGAICADSPPEPTPTPEPTRTPKPCKGGWKKCGGERP